MASVAGGGGRDTAAGVPIVLSNAFVMVLRTAVICTALCAKAHSANFKLDFVAVPPADINQILPSLAGDYKDARFSIAQFSSASGVWRLVRVESASTCDREVCLTILQQDEVQWLVAIHSSKSVVVSLHDPAVEIQMPSRNRQTIVRATGNKKIILLQ